MADGYLLEDGSGRLLLENGSGVYELDVPPPLLRDDFDRPNSTTSMGSTLTGQTWTPRLTVDGTGPADTWGISDGKAYNVEAGDDRHVNVEVGTGSAMYVGANFYYAGAGGNAAPGLSLKYVDRSNFVYLEVYGHGVWQLRAVEAGGYSTLASGSQTVADGDFWEIQRTSDGLYTIYLNGNVVDTASSAANANGTRAGFRYCGAGGWALRWDGFVVGSPVASALPVVDGFSKPNSTTSAGRTANTGPHWHNIRYAPKAGVANGRAYSVDGGTTMAESWLDTGQANADVEITGRPYFNGVDAQGRLSLKYDYSGENGYNLLVDRQGSWVIQRFTADSASYLASGVQSGTADGDEWTLSWATSGALTARWKGTQVGVASDTTHAARQKAAFTARGASQQWDDIKIGVPGTTWSTAIPATLVTGNTLTLDQQSFENGTINAWGTNYWNPADTSASLSTDAYDGTYAMRVTTTTSFDYFGPEVPLAEGQTIRLTAWMKLTSGSVKGGWWGDFKGNAGYITGSYADAPTTLPLNTWTQVTQDFVGVAGQTAIGLRVHGTGTGGSVLIDRLSAVMQSAAVTVTAAAPLAAPAALGAAAVPTRPAGAALAAPAVLAAALTSVRRKAHLFTDDFSGTLATLWDHPVDASNVSGQLVIVPSGNYPTIISKEKFDLAESSVTVEFVSQPTGNTAAETYFDVRHTNGAKVTIGVFGNGSLLHRSITADGTVTDIYDGATSDARWLRLAQSGGVTTWSTSLDRVTWTTRRTSTLTFTLEDADIRLGSGFWNNGAQPTNAVFDNLNIAPAAAAAAALTAPAALGAAGTRSAVAAAALTAPATISATATRTQIAAAALTAPAAVGAAATRTQPAAAVLLAPAAVAASGVRTQPATAALLAPAAVQAAAVPTRLAAAALTAAVAVAAGAVPERFVATGLTAPAALTAAASTTVFAQAAANLTAAAALTASAVPERYTAAALTAAASLVTQATPVFLVAASLTAPAAVTAAATPTRPAAAALAAALTVGAAALVERYATAGLTAPAALAADGVTAEFVTATAALAAPAALAETALHERIVSASLTAPTALTATSTRTTSTTAALTAPAAFQAAAVPARLAAANLTAAVALSSTALLERYVTASLTAPAAVQSAATPVRLGAALLTAPVTVSAAGVAGRVAAAALAAPVAVAVQAVPDRRVTAALTAQVALSAQEAVDALAAAALTAPAVIAADATLTPLASASAAFTAPAALAAAASLERYGAVALAAPAVLAASPEGGTDASAALGAAVTLSTAAERATFSAAALIAPAVLTAAVARAASGTAALTAPAALVVSTVRSTVTSAALAAPVALAAQAVLSRLASAALTAPAAVTATGLRTAPASVALTAPAVLVAGAIREQQAAVFLAAALVLTAGGTRDAAAVAALAAAAALTAQTQIDRPALAALTAPAVLAAAAQVVKMLRRKPSSDLLVTGWTAVPSGSVWQVLSDDNVSTYATASG